MGNDAAGLGRALLVLAAVLAAAGLLLLLAPRLPLPGRLPGDIVIRRRNFVLYLPLATSILISVLLTLLIRWLRK